MSGRIRIIVRGADHVDHVRRLAERKILRALHRFEPRVLAATMRLEDETGPSKGGVDKVCSLDVKLRDGEVRIRERADGFEAAIQAGCRRLRSALGRETARVKQSIHAGPRGSTAPAGKGRIRNRDRASVLERAAAQQRSTR